MHLSLSRRGWIWLALAAFLAWAPQTAVRAQDLGNGSDLLDMFRNMPSSQQQQILNRLGGGQLSGFGGLQGNFGQRNGEEEAQNQNRRTRRDEEENELRIPLFKGEDYVVVEVDTKPLPPRP